MNAIIIITCTRPCKNAAWKSRRRAEIVAAFGSAYKRTAFITTNTGYLSFGSASCTSNNNSTTIVIPVHAHNMDDKDMTNLFTAMSLLMDSWEYQTSFQVFDDFLTQPLDNAEQDGTIRA